MQHNEQAERKKGSLSHVGVTAYATDFVALSLTLPVEERWQRPIQDINDAKRPAFHREHQEMWGRGLLDDAQMVTGRLFFKGRLGGSERGLQGRQIGRQIGLEFHHFAGHRVLETEPVGV